VSAVKAIVLAAGLGRRLGLPKAALQLRGQWMLPRLIRTLRQGGVDQVHLCLSDAALDAIADLGDPGADREWMNPNPDAGRMASLQAALPGMEENDALLVHPCDMPLLRAQTVLQLRAAYLRHPAQEFALIRPVSSGRRGGHPLLLGPAWQNLIRDSEPDRPLREFLRLRPDMLHDIPVADDPGAFLDVDTPEQLQLLEALLDSA